MSDVDHQGPLQVTLLQLLRAMIERGASDLHITRGTPPQFRIDGSLVPLKMAPLRAEDTKQLVYSVLTDDAEDEAFEEAAGAATSRSASEGLSRFRANVFMQRGAVGRGVPR
jgi:twitching motility protein PilT